jgi:hypothetical protein
MIYVTTPIGACTMTKEWLDSRDNAVTYLRGLGYNVETEIYQGPHISVNMNKAIFTAQRLKAEWLVMLDNDMVFNPPDIYSLIHSGREVVTGVYKQADGQYCLYDYLDGFTGKLDSIKNLKPVVDVSGLGFFAIRRNVIEKLCSKETQDKKWVKTMVRDATLNYPFNMVTAMDCTPLDEAMSFCLRLRELGIQINVLTTLLIGHQKLRIV